MHFLTDPDRSAAIDMMKRFAHLAKINEETMREQRNRLLGPPLVRTRRAQLRQRAQDIYRSPAVTLKHSVDYFCFWEWVLCYK